MSARYFCDGCGEEVTGKANDRLRRSFDITATTNLAVEVMVRLNGTWNTGHICTACVIRVVTVGTDLNFEDGWLSDQNRRAREAQKSQVLINGT